MNNQGCQELSWQLSFYENTTVTEQIKHCKKLSLGKYFRSFYAIIVTKTYRGGL